MNYRITEDHEEALKKLLAVAEYLFKALGLSSSMTQW